MTNWATIAIQYFFLYQVFYLYTRENNYFSRAWEVSYNDVEKI